MDLRQLDELDRTERLAWVRFDQRRRWQQGDCVLVESYLERFPALRADEESVLDLLCSEVLLRHEQGKPICLPEYAGRFPHCAERMKKFVRMLELSAVAPDEQAAAGPAVGEAVAATLPPAGAGAADGLTLTPAQQPPELAAGEADSVPGYELLSELGRGGMGVIFEARQVSLNRVVALKMILAGAHAGPEQLRRFRSEAEAVARLQHPGIVQIFEIGEHRGNAFFSLELVGGGSLADRLDGKPMAAKDAARLVEALARSIHAAHQSGIVHRDLKPANILLTPEGQPKITDFGLAKYLETDRGQTKSGEILGTPSYMAPEQAAGRKDVGKPADIYALGAILYELLTGRPPFRAETILDTLLQVMEAEAVPVRQLNPKAPRELAIICWKCLSKKPAERYADALALADDLHRFLEGEPIKARPLGVWRRLDRGVRKLSDAAGCGVLFFVFFLIMVLLTNPTAVIYLLAMVATMTALVRAKLKPLAGGVVAGLIAIVVGLGLYLLMPNLSELVGRASLTPALCLLPPACGLVAGTLAREGWRTLLYVPILAVVAFAPRGLAPVSVGLWICLGFAMLGRWVAWYYDGSAPAAILGGLVGLLLSSFAAAAPLGYVLTQYVPSPSLTLKAVFLFILAVVLLGGTVLGAILGGRPRRKKRT
jgi:hypothetical protein